VKQAKILEAEGEARAIQLVNEAADRYFVGNAQLLRRLMAVEKSLSSNAKIIVPANAQLVNVVGDLAGVLPTPRTMTAAVAEELPFTQRHAPAPRSDGAHGPPRT